MANLGSFGAAVRELDPGSEKDTFEFFGETFTVHGTLPQALMMQVGAAMTGRLSEADGLGALWEAMHVVLTVPAREAVDEQQQTTAVPADGTQFHRWFQLAVQRCCALEELWRLLGALYGVQSGRPTEEPHGSSPGQSTSSTSSNTSSSTHPGLAHLRPVAEVLAG